MELMLLIWYYFTQRVHKSWYRDKVACGINFGQFQVINYCRGHKTKPHKPIHYYLCLLKQIVVLSSMTSD